MVVTDPLPSRHPLYSPDRTEDPLPRKFLSTHGDPLRGEESSPRVVPTLISVLGSSGSGPDGQSVTSSPVPESEGISDKTNEWTGDDGIGKSSVAPDDVGTQPTTRGSRHCTDEKSSGVTSSPSLCLSQLRHTDYKFTP